MTNTTSTSIRPLTEAQLAAVVGGAGKNPIGKLIKPGCGCGKGYAH